MSSQARFETVYRGRQTWLHHASYMRVAKVLIALRALRRAGVAMEGKKIFDYGFGAGTFFRHCPKSCRLFGVEQDPVAVNEAAGMLRRRGFKDVDLREIEIEGWESHPLLGQAYDIFVCSHVLEHLEDPAAFLRFSRRCLAEGGVFLGIVPINERASNPHHVQIADRRRIESWAASSGYKIAYYEENDPFLYWAQPLYTAPSGIKHKLAQAIGLDMGLSATLFGERFWFAWAKVFGPLTLSRPTQAVFLLRPA